MAAGVLGAIKGLVGSAAGVASAQATSAAVKGMTGASAGVASAQGRLASVLGMVGSAVVGAGGGAAPIYPLVIFDD